MKHLIFNWIIRKYWGEKLAAEVMQFVLNYKLYNGQFIMESPTGGLIEYTFLRTMDHEQE